MKYRFINEHRHEYRVAAMCQVLKVARAGFYAWLHQPNSNRAIQDERLLGLIRDAYGASGGVYGSPRGRRIMRNHKIQDIRSYKSPKAVRGRP